MRNPGIEKISIVLLLSMLPGQLGAQASLEPVAGSLQARGLTPGGEVAWIGVWREPVAGGAYTEITQLRETTVADASGRAILELGRAVPALSAWGAVDLQSGSHAVTSGPLHRGRQRRIDRTPSVREPLSIPSRVLELLVVRSGGIDAGAWYLSAKDGARGDGDLTTDGAIRPLLSEAEGASAPPASLAAGDVVIGIDPRSLGIVAFEVAP